MLEKLTEQLDINFGRRVPVGGIPLGYLSIPTPNAAEHVKLVGTGRFSIENIDSLTTDNTFNLVTIRSTNVVNSFAVSGLININRIFDPTFFYGLTPSANATWSVSGSWDWNQTGGRSDQNCVHELVVSNNIAHLIGDEPGGRQSSSGILKCAYATWANSGTSSLCIASLPCYTRISTGEALYSRENVVYQLSLWLATDPVDQSKTRRGSQSWQKQSVEETRVTVQLIGCDNSGQDLEILWQEDIGWNNPLTRHMFNQPEKKYLRFRSPYIRTLNTSVDRIRVKIFGQAMQGVYLDDIRLASYFYAIGNRSNDTGVWVVGNSGGTTTSDELLANGNLILNPEFQNNNVGSSYFTPVNLMPDPSFELGQWTAFSSATIELSANDGGAPRTGNRYLELDAGSGGYSEFGEQAAITVTGLDNNKVYTMGGWHRHQKPQYIGSFDVATFFKVQFRNNNTVLGTYYSPIVTGGASYAQMAFSINASGLGANNWRVSIICSQGVFSIGHIWDDIFIYDSIYNNPFSPYWSIKTNQALSGSYGVLQDNEAGNNFGYLQYTKPNDPGQIYHVLFRTGKIYKNNLFTLDYDFTNRYFNTYQSASTSGSSVNTTDLYGLNYSLMWFDPNPDIILDSDPSLRGAFAEPFTIIDTGYPGGIRPINKYGYFRAVVEGLSASGGVLETPLDVKIGPEQGNIPAGQYIHQPTGNKYVPVQLPKFKFTDPASAKWRVTFSWVAANVGLLAPTFSTYSLFTVSTSGSSGSFENLSVYNLSSKISIDKLVIDETGAWYLGIKDGLFRKSFTMSDKEPSTSWLRDAGFIDGDELILVYTVPEFNMSLQWDPEKHLKEIYRRSGSLIDNHTLQLDHTNIHYISEILVNGVTFVSGSPSGFISTQSIVELNSSLIESIDTKKGSIKFIKSFNDYDNIEVSYIYKEDRYIYKGYYDGASWHELDLNPEAGHRWDYGQDSSGLPGNSLINNSVNLYLLPTAAYYASGNVEGNYTYKSAWDISPEKRPISFVRHEVITNKTDNEDSIASLPSAMMIGKIFVVPPGSISDIKPLDVRSRGGGYPDGYKFGKQTNFVEESRTIIRLNDNWLNSRVLLYENDQVSLVGSGWASGTVGGIYAIKPDNALYYTISSTTPASSFVGTLLGSGLTTTITSATTGSIYFKIKHANLGTTGQLYATTRIRRKLSEGSVWDRYSYDGQPIMINGTVIFEVPKSVLTGSNGYTQVTADQVQDAIEKHTAAGILAITRYTE